MKFILHVDLSVMLYQLIESFLKYYRLPHGQLDHKAVSDVISKIKTVEDVFIPYIHNKLRQEIKIIKHVFDAYQMNDILFYIDIDESWRKSIEIEGITYKDRDRKAMGHYYYLFDIAFNRWQEWLPTDNIYGYKHIEADDYMLYMAYNTKNDDKLHVFWTVDADIRQVMHSNIVMFSVFTYKDRQNCIYLTRDSVIKPFDINLYWVHLVETIDPKYELLIKLFMGDKTDTIPAFIKGKYTRADMYALFDSIPSDIVDNAYDNSDGFVELINWLKHNTKLKIVNMDTNKAVQIYNIVKLDLDLLPDDIKNNLFEMNKIDLSKHKKFDHKQKQAK